MEKVVEYQNALDADLMSLRWCRADTAVDMGEFQLARRNKFGNRTISLERYISDVVALAFPTAKKIVGKQVKEALKKLSELISTDTYDLKIPGIGTIQTTLMAGQEKYIKHIGVTTLYPPGAIKIRLKPSSAMLAKSRCSILRRDGQNLVVKKEYEHLYRKNGEPIFELPVDLLFDTSTVSRKRFAESERLRIEKLNGNKNGK